MRRPSIDPETLADLKVLVTVKEDKIVYDAQNSTRRGDLLPSSTPFGDPEAALQSDCPAPPIVE